MAVGLEWVKDAFCKACRVRRGFFKHTLASENGENRNEITETAVLFKREGLEI